MASKLVISDLHIGPGNLPTIPSAPGASFCSLEEVKTPPEEVYFMVHFTVIWWWFLGGFHGDLVDFSGDSYWIIFHGDNIRYYQER